MPVAEVLNYLDTLEVGVCRRVNRLSRKKLVRIAFAAISKLGDGGFWGLMALLLVGLQGFTALYTVFHIALTAGVGVLVYKLLKERMVRERPFVTHGEISCGAAPLDEYSFPSGHTLHAVSFTVMFGIVEPLLIPVMVPFAVLVALSRIVLGLHYPSDVLVGAAIGATLATASIALM